MEKKTYWKVQVETYDYGAVKAGVVGSKVAEAAPQYRRSRRPGVTAEVFWFEDKGNAEYFARIKRTGEAGK